MGMLTLFETENGTGQSKMITRRFDRLSVYGQGVTYMETTSFEGMIILDTVPRHVPRELHMILERHKEEQPPPLPPPRPPSPPRPRRRFPWVRIRNRCVLPAWDDVANGVVTGSALVTGFLLGMAVYG